MTATVQQHRNLVGGEWRPAAGGEWLEVRNPALSSEVVGSVPAMAPDDVAEVYAAASNASADWAALSPVSRGRILLTAARLLRERRELIAYTLTSEMGKTFAEALGEVDKSSDFFEYYGGHGRAPVGQALAHELPGARAWTRVEPVGIVLAISPWNDPLLTPSRKLAPALIAGNAVVLKPASHTPIVALLLARVLTDAGLPAGVLGTVTGTGATIGDSLLGHEELAAVSFTGSNAVGAHIRARLAGRNVKLLAELGGKNALVVLADADMQRAVEAITAAGFGQAGQRCTAASRIVVERSVAGELIERLARAAERMVLGPGTDDHTTMGPLVSAEQREAVSGYVERATRDGARVVTGGTAPSVVALNGGHFFEPTVVAEVEPESEVWREEIFGPVLAVLEVADLQAAITTVNDSPYGLAAAIFTGSLASAERFMAEVDTGQVAVNLPTSGWDVHFPFGGAKASGSGLKEQGEEGLSFYTRTKTVVMAP